MKHDLSEITFLTFVRLDNDERIKNLQAMHGFYRKHCENYTHIIIEDDTTSKVPSHLELTKDDVYVFTRSTTEWKKCEGFNKGIKLAKTNILTLIDTDIIIHPEYILDGARTLTADKNSALIYPFNGLFLCAEKELKDKFCETLQYETLGDLIPTQFLDYTCSRHSDINQLKQYINGVYDGVLVGHIDSKGGCVMGRRDNLIRGNGYNPLFHGWGYEDDEVPVRMNGLGYGVGRLEGKLKVCWHLHHFDGTGSEKETQPHYDDNKNIYDEICQLNKEQLQQYITRWRM